MTVLTEDYTFAYTDAGTILNTNPSSTTPFVDVTKVSGLDNAEYRITEREREGMDGGFIDSAYEKMRLVVLEGIIYNATETFLDTLKANFAPSSVVQPFYFRAPVVGERIVYAKSYGINFAIDNRRSLGIIAFQIQLKAEDPTIYGGLLAGFTVIGGASTGYGFNLAFPLGFGGTTSTNGTIAINNIGNKDSDATFTFAGAVTNPAVSNDTTGDKLTFVLTLGAADTLTVNLRNRTAILNGTANRRGVMTNTSRWFMIKPGLNSLRFLGTAGSPTPSMSYITRPAYR
jgi:hypothetical protein